MYGYCMQRLILYTIIFILLVSAEIIYFKIADKYNIIDKPNERSSHTGVIIRGGGIIFTIGILLYALFFNFPYPVFIGGLLLITVISFIDDTCNLSSKIRITVHFTAMALMFWELGLMQNSPWWYIPIALIVCTGIINACNFMDGINGMTGGYSTVLTIIVWFINRYVISFTDGQLLLVLLLALLVFNFYNFRKKARCFAGDVGSVSIAFILLFLIGQLMMSSQDLGFIILFGVYGIDSIFTIIHRLILKENIFKPHRKHVYQLMANELKIPHIWVSSGYMLLQTLLTGGYIYFYVYLFDYRYYYFFISLGLLAVAYIFFKKKYYHLHLNS